MAILEYNITTPYKLFILSIVNTKIKHQEGETYVKAIRLYNIEGEKCSFETGMLPTTTYMETSSFFIRTHVGTYGSIAHPAPRKQYVVTLKGKLEFTVSNGDTFYIEPGIILIAEDILGIGHTWKVIEGNEWERLYIPLHENASNHFIKDK
ncbi:hypothetical protein [Flavobacterium sp. '19STA2R22 D10 B1']|uniref:hypothetical protein n=1 Tax=Flavobacterium aerium TaxID=3037261 RepID=UPI00278C09C9|nr:hypothetical protein [Flavobacterium sp. '19STA2R22 D10 B1']